MIYESYIASVILLATGLFCIVYKSSLIKKIIGLGIFSNAMHLLIVTIGFRQDSIAPIVTPGNINAFASLSVDPLPQALVLTSIVIDASVTALALIIIIWIFRRTGTKDARELRHLKG
jgi:multicomponent Na+:H+ antiporter subunit C